MSAVNQPAPARHIVMLEALCNNERGWARIMSKHGRVSLAQIEGFKYREHLEIWEAGRCVRSTPERACIRLDWLNAATWGAVLALTTIRRGWWVFKKQRADVTIACANSMCVAALIFRFFGRTQKVVCLVSDYFPPHDQLKPHVWLYRKIGALMTSALCWWSDEVWTVSPRIPTIAANPRNFFVPICVNDEGVLFGERKEIIYIGMPSPDHALDLLFKLCRQHGLKLNVVGDSSYLKSIKHLAPEDTVFHGFISDPERIKAICSRCFCGYAVYRNVGPRNYSYFGIPSKTLNYLASNIPILTTNTADFSQYIEKYGIGRVVSPEETSIEQALLDLQQNARQYYDAINQFRSTWNAQVEAFHDERLKVLLG